MSTPITEAHRELARNIMFYHTPKGSATAQGVRDAAQLIADSEAKACEQLRNELAAERARLDYINALSPNDAWVISSTGPFAMAQLRAGDPRTLRILPGIRAAIDAAIKERA